MIRVMRTVDAGVTTKMICLLFLLLLPMVVGATTFKKTSLDSLVGESSAAAEVELQEKKSSMNKMGVITTEYVFNVRESYNISEGDLDGKFLRINLVGGTVDGVTSFIDGAPEFSVGERSFLLLKSIESKMYISNFTMGKYKVEEKDGQVFYVSSVFPEDVDIGRVSKERMVALVKEKFKATQDAVEKKGVQDAGKKVSINLKKTQFEGRIPAEEKDDFRESHEGLTMMWAFFVLFLTSGFVIWWKLRKGMRE